MTFGQPAWLAVLPLLLAALAGLWACSARRRRQLLESTFNTPLRAHLTGSVSTARRRWKLVLTAAGVLALGLALARPRWGRSEIEIERTGIDLVIALDVSRSMLAADAAGTNRLTAATAAIRRLVDTLGGDRTGLLLFAGDSYVAAPLTRDHTALGRALEAAAPWMVSEQGSDLASAIRRGRTLLGDPRQGPRTLLLVSDGEDSGGNAVAAAREAGRNGVQVHTASVGSSTGARLPRSAWDRASFLKNSAGREVVSRRDDAHLQRIASAGGGRHVRLEAADSPALADWFREAAAPLGRTTEKRLVNEPREQFSWPLAASVILLAAAGSLPDRRRPPTPKPHAS